jgi:uncharacterized protein (TIGR03437 family)
MSRPRSAESHSKKARTPSSRVPKPVSAVNVMIGGKRAEIAYVGGVPQQVAGLLQINAKVPLDADVRNVPVLLPE